MRAVYIQVVDHTLLFLFLLFLLLQKLMECVKIRTIDSIESKKKIDSPQPELSLSRTHTLANNNSCLTKIFTLNC